MFNIANYCTQQERIKCLESGSHTEQTHNGERFIITLQVHSNADYISLLNDKMKNQDWSTETVECLRTIVSDIHHHNKFYLHVPERTIHIYKFVTPLLRIIHTDADSCSQTATVYEIYKYYEALTKQASWSSRIWVMLGY